MHLKLITPEFQKKKLKVAGSKCFSFGAADSKYGYSFFPSGRVPEIWHSGFFHYPKFKKYELLKIFFI